MSLYIDVEKKEAVLCVRLVGEVDHHSAKRLQQQVDLAIETSNIHHVLLNVEKVTFMDSSGLGVVLGRYKLLAKRGGKLAVCCVSPQVQRLFELSGLFKIIAVHSNEREALMELGVAS
ncbi:anti-sigma F factor antagonist [Paenalkalicoccus suaedae]|uniref:Anti-sigma F factor antagonist n=1 Tax=Paenalkalicoccus suaedae TaxID=2592382 RepID=A0A859FCR7_9BACI|nr:anti-sigma F factor antagonist [Paenalkalicoccus suaedae]QKS71029.1 anti-sigma F factor antagonist [Paenalkalicoccus suaedae]